MRSELPCLSGPRRAQLHRLALHFWLTVTFVVALPKLWMPALEHLAGSNSPVCRVSSVSLIQRHRRHIYGLQINENWCCRSLRIINHQDNKVRVQEKEWISLHDGSNAWHTLSNINSFINSSSKTYPAVASEPPMDYTTLHCSRASHRFKPSCVDRVSPVSIIPQHRHIMHFKSMEIDGQRLENQKRIVSTTSGPRVTENARARINRYTRCF